MLPVFGSGEDPFVYDFAAGGFPEYESGGDARFACYAARILPPSGAFDKYGWIRAVVRKKNLPASTGHVEWQASPYWWSFLVGGLWFEPKPDGLNAGTAEPISLTCEDGPDSDSEPDSC